MRIPGFYKPRVSTTRFQRRRQARPSGGPTARLPRLKLRDSLESGFTNPEPLDREARPQLETRAGFLGPHSYGFENQHTDFKKYYGLGGAVGSVTATQASPQQPQNLK